MLQFLRRSKATLVLKDEEAFWRHCDSTQRQLSTPNGPLANAEERLDLRAGQALKALLEAEVGPEEGPNHVQSQNWDWNDDRTRAVYMLRSAFRPDLIPKLQGLLVGEFADFRIIVVLYESWQSEAWGHLHLQAAQLAIQRNVAQAYAIAA
jgi:hypothetical protein